MPTPPLAQLSYDVRIASMRLTRRVRYTSTTLAPHFFAILVVLEDAPSTAAELAARERVSAPSMSRTVAELVERGFVDREQDPADRRRVTLTITDAGRAELVAARQERNAWMVTKLEACTQAERDTLAAAARIIERLLDET